MKMGVFKKFQPAALVLGLAVAVTMAFCATDAKAFMTYSTGINEVGNCANCHGAFNQGDPYVSRKAGAGDWSGNSLHDGHVGVMGATGVAGCPTCHGGTAGSGRTVTLGNSDGGALPGCTGCHGRSQDGPVDPGAGLRRHHVNAGAFPCYPGCHMDPASVATEDVDPPYYATLGMSACNADGSEDFLASPIGLDNDGDLAYDTADPDCAAAGCAGPADCNDGDPCTDDVCNPDGSCSNPAIICDDSNACTDDACGANGCEYTPVNCDDSNACTDDGCNPVTGCAHTPANCDDGDPCTNDGCNPASGCNYTPVNCDDNDPCTDDTCGPNGCVNTPIPGCGDPCAGVNCDDNNACTNDSCVDGQCINAPISCDDGNPCTDDACDAATGCVNTPVNCNDGDPCTDDACGANGCVNTPVNCDDGDPCTDDTCGVNGCVNTPANCDDGDPCTDDACGPNGCVNTPIPGCGDPCSGVNCDDNNACTSDSCLDGQCINAPISCDDGDPCTDDACDPATGCSNTPLNCDDGNACTDDACADGQCMYTTVNCDDGDPCTADSCNAATGCVNTPIPGCGDPCYGVNCDDGNACTDDSCVDGQCINTPTNCDDGNECTEDSCGENGCIHTPIPDCTPTCIPPVITAIRGSKQAAGMIRIIGTGFGNTPGVVHVNNFLYSAADHAGKLKLWTDTLIKVRLPKYKCDWFAKDKDGNPDLRKRKLWVVTADGCESNSKVIRVKSIDCAP